MKLFKKTFLFFTILLTCLSVFNFSSAKEIDKSTDTLLQSKVLEIIKDEVREISGMDTETIYQLLSVEILEGENIGQKIIAENDYIKLNKGDKFLLLQSINSETGEITYTVHDFYRLPILYIFLGIFILSIIILGGIQGVRGFVALAISLFFIIYLLLPGILAGHSPILISLGVSSLIVIIGSYITHGVNKTTSSAVLGMIITIFITGILAFIAVHFGKLSGFNSEGSVYLNFSTNGNIDFAGLLLGAILIGLLGILYDTSISQAIAVEELHRAAPHLSRLTIYKRALRMGREHIGALINTLAIAYVGVSLPLLLLFYSYQTDISEMLNREIFATEIVRIMVGSIGLIFAVPITTLIAVFVLIKKEKTL